MILDCTFRDGGYLNDWKWDIDFVKNTVKVLKNHVDIIELGYRSPLLDKFGSMGKFRFCLERDPDISCLGDIKGTTYGVMVDIADYMVDSTLDSKLLTDNFILQKNSIFTYVRVATTINNIKEAAKAVHILSAFGYNVMVSIMKRSTFEEVDITDIYNILRNTPMVAMYFADSFGAMTNPLWPEGFDINSVLKGVHCHNNLNHALSNTFSHIVKESKTIADASILGIGRGAGNCDLIPLLMMLNSKEDYQDLIDLTNDVGWFNLRNKYKWGADYAYIKSGTLNIHPKYVVEMKKLKIPDYNIVKFLKSIPDFYKHTFNKKLLSEVVKSYV